jgi:carbon storage regulator
MTSYASILVGTAENSRPKERDGPWTVNATATHGPITRGVGGWGPAAVAIHVGDRGQIRTYVTWCIKKSRYLHFTNMLVRIVPIAPDGPLRCLRSGRIHQGRSPHVLVLSRKLGQRILIGDRIVVTVAKLENGQVRLGIEAPREILVFREEIDPRLHPLVQQVV